MSPSPSSPPYGRVLVIIALVCTALQCYQAATSGPLYDETPHLASGVAAIRFSEFGYYRVNPPIHRIWSAIPVEIFWHPSMPSVIPASLTYSGRRSEFELGDDFFEANKNQFRGLLVAGRLFRIPIVLLGAAFLFAYKPSNGRVGFIAASLWLTSPLVLGFGWSITPDVFSGVAMAGVAYSSSRCFQTSSISNHILTGLAWGLAISTKFTFCPIFAMWPICIAVRQFCLKRLRSHETVALFIHHLAHGIIALIVVHGAYGFGEIGVPLGDHQFQSDIFNGLNRSIDTDRSVLSRFSGLPSPFPKQFLLGIDEQRLDFRHPIPTYMLGKWYPNGTPHYYIVSYLIKERLGVIFSFSLLFLSMSIHWYRTRSPDNLVTNRREHLAEVCFLIAGAVTVFAILSLHKNMALNTRYILPALPLLYLAAGLALPEWNICLCGRRFDCLQGGLLACVVVEMAIAAPNFIAYSNPIAGGAYRVPPALHASNFDWGQDLWRLEKWIQSENRGKLFVCMHDQLKKDHARFEIELPTRELLRKAINQHSPNCELARSSNTGNPATIVVFRGLGFPAPWTKVAGLPFNDTERNQLIRDLSKLTPDEFVTPTIGAFRVR